ncbi:MAG: hypothetical protein K0S47_2713 [Herbinix sp.]|jgi:AraC-like DNA-binding protein|nr:hypothetical protein [Herbinix sp.]
MIGTMKITDNAFEQLEFGDGYINVSIGKNIEVYPSHWHTEAEIIIPLEGSYSVKINNHLYHLKTNDILFITPGELHEMATPSDGLRMVLQFNFSLIHNLKDFNLFNSFFQSIKVITSLKDSDTHEKMLYLLMDIKKEYEANNSFKNAAIYSKLLQIYVIIARKYTKLSNKFPDTTINKHQEYLAKFTQVFSYINNNFTEHITLEEIADRAGFSKFHFSRLFQQLTNMSLNEYINVKRIAEAEVLLLNPNLTITDVSIQSGFRSISTFNRAFRLAKKCSPSEFKTLYNAHKNGIVDK